MDRFDSWRQDKVGFNGWHWVVVVVVVVVQQPCGKLQRTHYSI